MVERLASAMPDFIPQKDKELVRLLRAARHAQRFPAAEAKRGRPGRCKQEDLFWVVARLGDISERETSAHLSFSSLFDHYLGYLTSLPICLSRLESWR